MNTQENTDRAAAIRRVLWITLFCNIAVAAAKVAYGYFSHSVSIIADGFHSTFDGVSNVVGFVGIYFASRPPDEDHPYGYKKIETFFTIFIGVMMTLMCIEIFKQTYESFKGESTVSVTKESFIIMTITLVVNLFVMTYENLMGKKLKSDYLVADAKLTRSDTYLTTGVIIGLVFTKMGFDRADTIVGAIVGVLVAKAGIGILWDAAGILTDRKQVDPVQIREIAKSVDNVIYCHRVRTRGTNSHVFLDLHIKVNPDISVADGHKVSHIVEDKIKEHFKEVIDVLIHLEPYSD